MKKTILLAAACAAALAALAAPAASAQETPWLVRVRGVYLDPAKKSDPLGGNGASDRLSVNSKMIPELDISYFFTPNWATELVLTYPQEQDVSLDGSRIGTFKHLPPTLTLQYHFMPQSQWSPYVGIGFNYTRISQVDLLNGGATLESHSFGPAVQAGVDYKIDAHWSVNADIKKVRIRSDVIAASGDKLSNVHVDPWLIGIGVGYRF